MSVFVLDYKCIFKNRNNNNVTCKARNLQYVANALRVSVQ